MEYPDSIYLHAFNTVPQFGPGRLGKILDFFPSAREAYGANEAELARAGIEEPLAVLFAKQRAKIDLEQESEILAREQISLMDKKDSRYPKLLLEIANPPTLLYYKGVMENPDEVCVAVVGTRKITNYGRTVTPYLIEPLVLAGATVVSGLAFGVDSMVQQLSVNHGKRTVAVLGGGLDQKSFYPKEHALLADRIMEQGGAIVSEYPIGTPPLKHHFIARNRIISGMSLATVIVECSLKSGSLITAKYALEQNRTVFAVPGPIYAEQSKGPNNLIKMGARPLTDVNDVLEDLNLQHIQENQDTQSLFGDTPTETALLNIVSPEPMAMDEIIRQSGLKADEVTSALTFLEMKGKVRNLGGQQYVKSR